MDYGLSFAPIVPTEILWAALAVAALIAALLLAARSRGALLRVGALACLVLALANPSFTREDREPLSSVAVVVVDKSPSQNFGDRAAQTQAARDALTQRLGRIAGLEVRTVEAGESNGTTDGTRLFSALSTATADVPPDRVAGAILLTDGRVHDVPTDAGALGFSAPVHALITGHPNERDRRVALISAPRFGIVGQSQTLVFRIEDAGAAPDVAQVTIRRDGEIVDQRSVRTDTAVRAQIPLPHAGPNIVEIETAPVPGELTTINNRAVVSIDGVRDKLRVLLVSGEPHAGERTWRNLLKSDANVDLIHFTILRPPEKQDGTPINELSLIAFPVRELFTPRPSGKLDDFQLIIFDRYARQAVLPNVYLDNIAKYVRNGGAVLVAAGPDYAGPISLWRTPLDAILPSEPTGHVTEDAFYARLTDLGRRHPVTRGLEGANEEPPHWSRFFRVVDTKIANGTPLMNGAGDQPLLVLSREGEGRVGLILSDHIWLWARGYEGGGPHIDLLRRTAHWLMKQPDLDEEALRLLVHGHEITAQRQTMAEAVAPVVLTLPSGAQRNLTLDAAEPGVWRKTVDATELGLWRATDGKLTTLVNVGPANPKEFSEVTSTTAVMAPLASATGGDARRLADGSSLAVPRILGVRSSDTLKGDDWIGLKIREASVVHGIGVLPLFTGLLGLLLLIGSLALTWGREGR
jgi:hypothetical protein